MIGQNIIALSETSSTNTYAAKLLMAEKPLEGTIVYAIAQTKGKGQQGNTWESENGKNLTISVILYPSFIKPENQFLLNKFISLAVLDFVKYHLPANMSPKVKWPNDIYVKNKKIAGILIENAIIENKIEHIIVGIGININQVHFSSDVPNPISLKSLTGKEIIITECLKKLCEFLNNRYLQLAEKPHTILDNDYLQNNYRYNLFSDYMVDGSLLKLKICGISEYGKLRLIDKAGIISEFAFNEIKYII